MRFIILIVSFLVAFFASQFPEFIQHYHQRLGGAVDELKTIVSDIDKDAKNTGFSRDEALADLVSSTNSFQRSHGVRIRELIDRYDRLAAQKKVFEEQNILKKTAAFIQLSDSNLVYATYKDFKPALPLTLEGILFALSGFIMSFFILYPFTRITRSFYKKRKIKENSNLLNKNNNISQMVEVLNKSDNIS